MQDNIYKFLRIYKNKSYDEVPLTEADVLIGTMISYADFYNLSKTKKYDLENNTLKFEEFNVKKYLDKLAKNYFNGDEAKKLLETLFKAKRYRLTKIGYFQNELSSDNMTQFFALTAITKNYVCIFFRGTDDSLVGWKENLDMMFKDKLPSQKLAKKYLYKIAELTNKPIIIAGHSKGGNLAFYSYLTASKKIQNRVFRVYNFDGPGFKKQDVTINDNDPKLIKMVPSNDIVGMILENTDNYQIIKSYKKNVAAHDLFTRAFSSKTRYTMLKKNPPLSKYSVALKNTINIWMDKYNKKDYKDMVDFIYEIAILNKQSSTLNLKLDIIKKRKIYLEKISSYSTKKKEKMKAMTREFVKIYFSTLFGRIVIENNKQGD